MEMPALPAAGGVAVSGIGLGLVDHGEDDVARSGVGGDERGDAGVLNCCAADLCRHSGVPPTR
jgi:hypothetical protein